jgi:rhomboid family GlyGly-CTERM serine protease
MSRNLVLVTGLVVIVMLLLELLAVAEVLRYEREAVTGGELWRLWTAHLVHLGLGHTLLNAGGVVGIMLVVGDRLRVWEWLLGMVVAAPAISIALWLFKPELTWYVGLSGMLHGLVVAGAMRGLMAHHRLLSIELGILVVVAIKIGWEHFAGALPGSTEMSGGAVIVDAHLFGAVTGIVWGAIPGLKSCFPARGSSGR